LELLERHRPSTGERDLRGFEWHYLWRKCHDDRLLLTIDTKGFVWSVTWTHDGSQLVSTHDDGYVRFWDSRTGAMLKEFHDFAIVAVSMAISPDDQMIASGDGNGNLIIRDVRERDVMHRMAAKRIVWHLIFNADGTRLATVDEGGLIQIWSVADGR